MVLVSFPIALIEWPHKSIDCVCFTVSFDIPDRVGRQGGRTWKAHVCNQVQSKDGCKHGDGHLTVDFSFSLRSNPWNGATQSRWVLSPNSLKWEKCVIDKAAKQFVKIILHLGSSLVFLDCVKLPKLIILDVYKLYLYIYLCDADLKSQINECTIMFASEKYSEYDQALEGPNVNSED